MPFDALRGLSSPAPRRNPADEDARSLLRAARTGDRRAAVQLAAAVARSRQIAPARTLEEQGAAILDMLEAAGWTLSSPALKVRHATSPDGTVTLWLKPEVLYVSGGKNYKNARSWGSIRLTYEDVRVGWLSDLVQSLLNEGDWNEEHFRSSNPEGFCACVDLRRPCAYCRAERGQKRNPGDQDLRSLARELAEAPSVPAAEALGRAVERRVTPESFAVLADSLALVAAKAEASERRKPRKGRYGTIPDFLHACSRFKVRHQAIMDVWEALSKFYARVVFDVESSTRYEIARAAAERHGLKRGYGYGGRANNPLEFLLPSVAGGIVGGIAYDLVGAPVARKVRNVLGRRANPAPAGPGSRVGVLLEAHGFATGRVRVPKLAAAVGAIRPEQLRNWTRPQVAAQAAEWAVEGAETPEEGARLRALAARLGFRGRAGNPDEETRRRARTARHGTGLDKQRAARAAERSGVKVGLAAAWESVERAAPGITWAGFSSALALAGRDALDGSREVTTLGSRHEVKFVPSSEGVDVRVVDPFRPHDRARQTRAVLVSFDEIEGLERGRRANPAPLAASLLLVGNPEHQTKSLGTRTFRKRNDGGFRMILPAERVKGTVSFAEAQRRWPGQVRVAEAAFKDFHGGAEPSDDVILYDDGRKDVQVAWVAGRSPEVTYGGAKEDVPDGSVKDDALYVHKTNEEAEKGKGPDRPTYLIGLVPKKGANSKDPVTKDFMLIGSMIAKKGWLRK